MVFAFLIHNIGPHSLKMLFTQMFGFIAEDSSESREDRKKLLSVIASRVQSECEFERTTNNKSFDDALEHAIDGLSTIPEADTGIFFIAADENHKICPSPIPMVVVWRASLHIAFTLIISTHENRLLATNNMRILCNNLLEELNLLFQPKNALLYPDKIQNVVNQFLPNGQLLFMSHNIRKQFDKELERNPNK